MKTSRLKSLIEKEANRKFIHENLKADTSSLLFKFAKDEDKRLLIEQIASRQAIRKKLPEAYDDLLRLFPPKSNLEQSSSEAIAKLKADLFPAAKVLADLSGGFGIDFLYLMQKFEQGHFVEPNEELCELSSENLRRLLVQKDLHFYTETAESFSKENKEQFDLIYLDPSRRDSAHRPLYRPEEYQPNILEIKSELLKHSKQVYVKMSPMISIPEYLQILPETREVWVLSERNECKEVGFLLASEGKAAVKIRSFNLLAEGQQEYDSEWGNFAPINLSEIHQYLYLPNSSILKAGIQDQVAQDLKLGKLDPNSHLYSSPELSEKFPGRIFLLKDIHKAYAKSLRSKALQVISRNFPDSPEFISRKLKLKAKGAKDFLIATKHSGKPVFIEASLYVPSFEGNGG
ncbi:class I SAM-dependent methyltransferase [Croceimicrobium hydrocarbonivorans]|uniref:RsmD family RNA methyltransferase n=1 Tax=Croceimicrobium hydrocarbonivorans TaxID=2761580 RepID=A0A7H0VDJ1_9FLAO|nr:RsmD family RNA methyltransferase [Croceimicrobium hydrocarbonivorans]QNR23789.1 RsmD family RNA methyltransferase [Croceimicrobium hydrocarbonivorans]